MSIILIKNFIRHVFDFLILFLSSQSDMNIDGFFDKYEYFYKKYTTLTTSVDYIKIKMIKST